MSDPYGPPGQPNQPSPWSQPGQPGGSGEPAPGYPSPGYGQPSYGQPSYGGQPNQGQPGYGQPSYGQPSYGQPSYGQPSYPQPGYPTSTPPYQSSGPPYQQPGEQDWSSPYQAEPYQYGPPPTPRRSRGPLIAILAGLLVLVVVGAIAAAVVLSRRDKKTPTGTGSTTTASASAPAPSPTGAAGVTLTAPDRIGTLRKMSDQSQVAPMRDQMRNAGMDDPFAVIYEDTTAPGRTAIVWGGTGKAFGIGSADRQLDAFFTSAGKNLGGGSLGQRVAIDPGSVGGKAECAKVNGLGVTMTMCAWAGTQVLLGFIFTGLTPDKSGAQVRTMLSAIVKK